MKRAATIAAIFETVTRIEQKVDTLLKATVKEKQMFDEVIRAIETQTSVVNGVVALLDGLVAKLEELAGQTTVTPEQVQALADAIDANTQKLADAVVSHTPAAGGSGEGETPSE